MKKLISMLISITILVSASFTVSADDSAAAERRSRNIDSFFDAFPVITDEMTSDGTVTRAELACVINNILKRGSRGSISGNQYNFPDVNKDTEYYDEINAAVSLGYMNDLGVSGGFRPDDAVTDTEAAECMAHMLGVDYMLGADTDAGIWRAIYNADIRIERFSGTDNAEWIKELVYKSLNAHIGVVSGTDHGNTEMSVDNDTAYIEEYWNIKQTEGVLSANSILEINGKSAAGDNSVMIGDEKYISYLIYENNAYIGQYVTAYVSTEGIDEGRIMCMFPNERYEPSLVIDSRNVENLENLSRIRTRDKNGRTKTYSVSPLANVYFNFEYMGPVRAMDYSSDRVKAVLDAVSAGQSCEIILAASQRKGDYDFVWIRSFENYAVSSFTYSDYSIQDQFGAELKLEDAFRDNNVVLFDDEGKLANAAAIQENDILSLMLSYGSGGSVGKAAGYLSRRTVSGTLSSVSDDGCVIEGSLYYVSGRYKELSDSNDKNVIALKSGISSTFYLNRFNEISSVSFADYYKDGESYVFIMYAFYDNNEVKSGIKYLSEDGAVNGEILSEKVTINGARYSGRDIIDAMSRISGSSIVKDGCDVYKLAKITRANNEIKKISLAFSEARPEGSPADELYPDQILYSRGNNTDGTAVTLADVVYKNNTFGKRVGITTSTVIFDVPIKNGARVKDEDAYMVTSVSNMMDDCVLGLGGVKKIGDDGKGAYMEFFDTDSTLFASAAVRYYSYDAGVGGVASPPEMLADCLIVSRISGEAVNEDDEPIKIIEGYQAGAKVKYETAPIRDTGNPWGQFVTLTDPEKGAKLEYADGSVIAPEDISSTGILPGDVIQLTLDSRNRISNMLINLRGGEKERAAWLMMNGNGTTTSILSAGSGHGNEYLGVNYGEVTEIKSGKMVLQELDGKQRVYSIGSPTITVYDRSAKKNNARKGGTGDIKIGRDVYVRQYYSQIKEIVVFED